MRKENMLKKIFTAVMLALVVALVATVAGCKKDEKPGVDPPPPTGSPSVTITNKTEVLELGDLYKFEASAENAGDETVVFSSSAPEIISIAQNGNAEAKAAGQATVTAALGDKCSDSVTVTVTDEYIPVLESGVNETVNINVDGTYRAPVRVTYKGATVTDALVFTYTSSRPEIAAVADDGTVTGVSEGESVITVKTTYRLREISTQYTVKVIPDIYLGISAQSVALSTLAYDGKQPTATLTATPMINGSAGAQTVTWISSNTSAATVSNGVVTAVGQGETTITASFEYNSKNYTAKCAVSVVRPELSATLEFDYEISKDMALPTENLPSAWNADIKADFVSANIVDIKSGGKSVALASNKKQIDPNLLVGSETAQELTVVTGKADYTVSAVTVYNLIVRDKSDLTNASARLKKTKHETADAYYFDGYIVFDTDVDFEDAVYTGIVSGEDCGANKTYSNSGFRGTLDGRGHAIKQMTTKSEEALFKYLHGTVKNLSFTDCSVGETATSTATGLLAMVMSDSTVENVYVEGKLNITREDIILYRSVALVANQIMSNVKFRNVTVRALSELQVSTGSGAVSAFGLLDRTSNDAVNEFENCAVIGTDKLYATKTGDRLGAVLQNANSNIARFSGLWDYVSALETEGYSYSSVGAPTCDESGKFVFTKSGAANVEFSASAAGHQMGDNDTCERCNKTFVTVSAETDIRTLSGGGYSFASLVGGKTVQSVTSASSDITITSDNKLTATGDGVNALANINTPRVYTVTCTDGSEYTVNLTVWSLLIANETDLRSMNDYCVVTVIDGNNKSYEGYFKLVQDITMENEWDNQSMLATGTAHASDVYGFKGTWDGNGLTISNFTVPSAFNVALIKSVTAGATVKNLTLKGECKTASGHTGGFLAEYTCGGTFENIRIEVKLANGYLASSEVLVGSGLLGRVGGSTNGMWKKNDSTDIHVKNVVIINVGEQVNNGAAIGFIHSDTWGVNSNPADEDKYITMAKTKIKFERVDVVGFTSAFMYLDTRNGTTAAERVVRIGTQEQVDAYFTGNAAPTGLKVWTKEAWDAAPPQIKRNFTF